MTQQLTAVSLFAGVGGFDLALERNGVNVVAAVEIDNNARGVLKHRFPNTQLFSDVMEVTGEQLLNAGFNPDRGIIVGGFPCQDLSVAGKRAGLGGARSGLFWEICRLLDETKARYFILENVPGLLSSNNGADLGAVIGALVERGYGVSYRILDAQHFGVAQRRRRIFIVGSLGGHWGTSSEILDLRQGRRGNLEASIKAGKVTPASTSDSARAGNFELYDFPAESVSPSLNASRAHDTITYSKARRAQNVDDFETSVEGDVTPTLNVFDNHTETRATELIVARMQAFGQYEVDDTASSLKARDYKDATDLVVDTPTVRRLTPTECERLQGFPDGWTSERFDFKKDAVVAQADSNRYKQMGNAVAVPVVQWIISRLVEVDGASA